MPDKMIQSLDDLLEVEYNVKTTYRVNPLVVEVQNALTLILPNNPKRLGFVFVNLSANTIYVAPDTDAAADHGILLAANGGSVNMSWREDFNLCALNWYGLATGANSDFFAIEIIVR